MNRTAAIEFVGTAREALLAQLKHSARVHDDELMLAYMPRFVNSDGTVVRGFVPGYTPIPLGRNRIADSYVRGEPMGGPAFYFMPRHRGEPAESYQVALTGFTFQITPAG